MSQPYPPHHQPATHPGPPGHPGHAAAPQAYPPHGYSPPPMYPQPNVPPWPQPWPNTGPPEPIFQVRVIKHTGALVFWSQHSYTVTGTFAQCSHALHQAQIHNLLAGWWSFLSVLALNWIALISNAVQQKRLQRHAADAQAHQAHAAHGGSGSAPVSGPP